MLKDPNGEAPVGATPTDHTPRYEDPMRNGAGGDPKSGSSGGGKVRSAVQGVIKNGASVGESTIQQEEARNRREAQSQVQIAEGKGTFGGKQSTYNNTTENQALRNAKEAHGVPKSQQPKNTFKPGTEAGKKMGLDKRNIRMDEFVDKNGKSVYIRLDKAVQYKTGPPQAKHFNAGSNTNPSKGTGATHHFIKTNK